MAAPLEERLNAFEARVAKAVNTMRDEVKVSREEVRITKTALTALQKLVESLQNQLDSLKGYASLKDSRPSGTSDPF